MNKRERVQKLLSGQSIDRVPAGFWLHFPNEAIQKGTTALVNEHIKFKNETKVDILKIMNENEMRQTEKIMRPADWRAIPKLTKKSALVTSQVELLKRVLDENNGECYTLGTVHGIMASLSHSSGHSYSYTPTLIKNHLKEHQEDIQEGLKIITENTAIVLEETLKTGVDGIFYAALGGESNKLTNEEFSLLLAPKEKELLSLVTGGASIFLHMCKEQVELKRYEDYPADVVNWAFHESQYSLAEAKEIFKDKVILGGFDDRSGELVSGDKNDISRKLENILTDFEGFPLILGADCTLPTEISYEKIKYVVDELELSKNK